MNHSTGVLNGRFAMKRKCAPFNYHECMHGGNSFTRDKETLFSRSFFIEFNVHTRLPFHWNCNNVTTNEWLITCYWIENPIVAIWVVIRVRSVHACNLANSLCLAFFHSQSSISFPCHFRGESSVVQFILLDKFCNSIGLIWNCICANRHNREKKVETESIGMRKHTKPCTHRIQHTAFRI